ncbi:MAG: hypothetical protein JJT78_06130 [Leptospira sp.]|nr:hypothetical protein [Leptospira sp.]
MIKYIRQPEKILKIAVIFLFSILLSLSLDAEKGSKNPIQLDDLLFYEKIILDFYAEGALREQAVRSLETRCRWSDSASGLSCANLSILYKNLGDLPRAYTAAAIAYKKEPKNNYYRNLFQNMAIRSGNLSDMEKRMGNDGKIFTRYNRVIQACNDNLGSRVLSDVNFLVQAKHITKEQLQRGIFYECYKDSPDVLNSLQSLAIGNRTSYTQLLRDEEDRFNAYNGIWDLVMYRKELSGQWKDDDIPSTELSVKWMGFKKSLESGNANTAKESLKDVRKILDELKKQSPKQKIVAESLELAIGLTLAQDPDFKDKVSKLGIVW